jgi:16S rRNA (guanine966-N2)-methyltransferase
LDVRPTADRVREALFSYLSHRLLGAAVLDVFAGSGALGLEALSRGAARAVFIENHRRHREILQRNIAHCGFFHQSEVIGSDAIAALRSPRKSGPFDLIFLDPPYDSGLLEAALRTIAACSLLSPEGAIIAEHRTGTPLAIPDSLTCIRTRTYGNTALSTLTRTAAFDEPASATERRTP